MSATNVSRGLIPEGHNLGHLFHLQENFPSYAGPFRQTFDIQLPHELAEMLVQFPCRRVLPEKLTVPQSIHSPHFMETGGSLQCSQQPTTNPNPEPD